MQYLSNTLKKKLLDSILFILESYPYCSISLQQGVEILKILQNKFAPEDMQIMIGFIIRNLSQDKMTFQFESGRNTSAMNKGQLMQIAIELKQIFKLKEIELPEWKAFEEAVFNEEEDKWMRKLDQGRNKDLKNLDFMNMEMVEIQLDDDQDKFNNGEHI